MLSIIEIGLADKRKAEYVAKIASDMGTPV
jgi:hypothetical protein